MTSIGSSSKQIPLNNAYYRTIPSLAGASALSSFLYTPTASNSLGMISTLGASASASALDVANALSTALFKDMGRQEVVNGSTFRRVQYVAPTTGTAGTAGAVVNGVNGGTVPSGVDGDYYTFYICLGFGGNGTPGGPFIRTG
jgi:hypothetical protein